MPNIIVKMMLQGVNLVSKPKVPQVITSTLEAAMTAAEKEVADWS